MLKGFAHPVDDPVQVGVNQNQFGTLVCMMRNTTPQMINTFFFIEDES